MPLERFVSQLERGGAARCVLCGGKVMNGLNCTCASTAMWLYRASQGRIETSACHVRDLTDDCSGGTNLRQMQTVAVNRYGITNGRLYQPGDADMIFAYVETNRYGAEWSGSYAPMVGTSHDNFRGQFRGNHTWYLSGKGRTSGTLRVGDPGGSDFEDIPKTLLKRSAGLLDLGSGHTLNDEYGGGKAYAYVTPADPPTDQTLYHFRVTAKTPVYHAPETKPYRVIYSGSGKCRKRKVSGHLWFQVVKPGSAIDTEWLHAGPTIEVTPI